MANVLVNAPKTAKKGDTVEIKALIMHPMETGFRPGTNGRIIPRNIVEDFTARPPKDQRAILIEVPMKSPPSINTDYPTKLPLATVPPGLLLKLPTLPDDLEYRFLGRHLILRDIKANLIVDFIPDVVPLAPASSKTAGREARP